MDLRIFERDSLMERLPGQKQRLAARKPTAENMRNREKRVPTVAQEKPRFVRMSKDTAAMK